MVYQFVSELKYFKPRMWRRFQISPEATVEEFAYALMSMYRMTGSHLYAVSVPVSSGKHGMGAVTFGIPSVYEDLPGVIDASSVTLESVLRHVEGMTLVLEYDFGDSWEVQATLEKVIEKDADPESLPHVLKGKYYGIVEDCGGVGGLEDLVQAFKEQEGPEFEHYMDWLGTDEFDFDWFDPDDINEFIRDDIEDLKEAYGSMDPDF